MESHVPQAARDACRPQALGKVDVHGDGQARCALSARAREHRGAVEDTEAVSVDRVHAVRDRVQRAVVKQARDRERSAQRRVVARGAAANRLDARYEEPRARRDETPEGHSLELRKYLLSAYKVLGAALTNKNMQ